MCLIALRCVGELDLSFKRYVHSLQPRIEASVRHSPVGTYGFRPHACDDVIPIIVQCVLASCPASRQADADARIRQDPNTWRGEQRQDWGSYAGNSSGWGWQGSAGISGDHHSRWGQGNWSDWNSGRGTGEGAARPSSPTARRPTRLSAPGRPRTARTPGRSIG